MATFKIGDSVKATRITPKRGKTHYYGFVTKLSKETITVEYYRGMSKGYSKKVFNIFEVVHDDLCSSAYNKDK